MATTIYTPAMLRGAGTRGVPEMPLGSSFTNTFSIQFPGADDRVSMGNVLDQDGSSAFSISVWVKYTSGGSNCVIAKQLNNAPGYAMFTQAVGVINYYISNGGSNYIHVKSTSGFNDGNWHHILATYDGSGDASGTKLYLDGSLDTTVVKDTFTSTSSNSANLQIGYRGVSNPVPWVGNIDEVSIFDSVIAIGVVWDGSGKPTDLSSKSNLVGWWRMGDGASYPTIPDDSSNSNDGTMTNMDAGDIVTDVP